MTFQLNLPQSKYPQNDQVVQAYQRILDEVRSIPGVKAAGAINWIPLVNFGLNGTFNIVGRPPFTQQAGARRSWSIASSRRGTSRRWDCR